MNLMVALQKLCCACGNLLELSCFNKDRGKKDGISNCCRICNSTRSKAWREKNSEKYRASKKEYCRNNLLAKSEYDKKRRAALSDSLRQYDRQRYFANHAENKRIRREYYLRNRENILKKNRIFRFINRESINAKANQDRALVKYKRAMRRAAIKNAIPLWADKEKIIDIYRQRVRITLETGVEHNVDHIVPLRSPLVCGLHWHENMQIITRDENLKKSNLTWPDMP